LAEVICFWATFFVFALPPIVIRCFPKEKIHMTLYAPDEESEEEDEDDE
jgi:hypothetical protein